MYTITKRFSSYKAAHRQWRHKGHCSQVHGECWSFDITLTAPSLDRCNFVFDFGEFKELRSRLDDCFDHTLLIDSDDPERVLFENLHSLGLAKVVFLPSCGAEGMAEFVCSLVASWLAALDTKAVVVEVTVWEDEKNSATYTP